ncbi:O-acetylhomoserine aminocarboxypropyltransferase/cysteine synthase [Lentisphaerota bacterium ZTH]|nr:O-acetylhomoserine aminocarboxypropyltransferase/cysteine synthase [Lentisphaerota bacterium]WET07181.1 O-acetylhomoserine aminocarboxypropyltransferase/cysteine synthase [Lentisphaerota bacterium ZTH]
MSKPWKIETNAVQAGYQPANGAPRVVPICQSTTYKYDDAQSVADLFDLKAPGHMYSRISNPTVEAFENKMAALEGGVAAVAASSGQTANTIAIMNCCPAGGHVLAAAGLYGGTVNLFRFTLRKMGVDVTFVEPSASAAEIKANVRPNTRAIFAETLANPALTVLDFEKFSKIASELELPLIIDNTFPSPFLCRPFEHGANIVTHSSTKYIDGHATSVGGVVIDGGNFDWTNGKFPEFTEPDVTYHGLVYTRDFKEAPFATKLRVQWIRDLGSYMSPMNAFLSNKGLETLHLRMERHSQNALRLAEFLNQHEKVSWVRYPGLPHDAEHERAEKYLPEGCSGVLCFGVKGGAEEGETVMNKLELAAIVVHVADVRTCVLHPASMTHRQLNAAEQEAAGVPPDLIRVSVGIENIDDIIADFDQALNSI